MTFQNVKRGKYGKEQEKTAAPGEHAMNFNVVDMFLKKKATFLIGFEKRKRFFGWKGDTFLKQITVF